MYPLYMILARSGQEKVKKTGFRGPRDNIEREDRRVRRQLRARHPVACIPLTPNLCRLRREWCQARAHWRTQWRSVVLSAESRFCLGANDVRVLVRRRPSERLQPSCLRPRHTGPTLGVIVCGAIS
ncbi:hypothetical protein AVEN_70475-1 [Araneus ventricosus]|uniref:Uncharacterized protein n=1 Tax=Araneus ventricosus TaxID=182803 RepID=A0A4Y2H2W1_ARAVE|nr:hypothetical protein AVEN_70475-1 [Araneus ventricosus]